uniref:Uncharacterized protein n=1 Tax=Mycena chlorophos TaxID=658473 RepID=A0ABQ0LF22_MYCCL|nr:predicted protein [Mycena chlorophos]
MSPYYGPDEPEATIEYERNFVAGDVVSGTGYGIQLVLYVTCARFLLQRRGHSRQHLFLLAYITLIMLLESLFTAVQARTVQMVYIDNRNYPGGPWNYFLNSQTAAVNVMFLVTLFLMTFLSDLLVLWRCWVIWAASSQVALAWTVISIPALMIFGSFFLGTAWTYYSTRADASFYSLLPQHLGTAYYAVSLGANVVLTLLIISRLVAYRRALLQCLPPDLASHYISLATVIVESAALYSVFAVLFLITYALNNPTNQIWLGVASDCQQIANLLIIYRLAEGSALGKDTLTTNQVTAPIHFRSGGAAGVVTTQAGTATELHFIDAAESGDSTASSATVTQNKQEQTEIV